MFRNSLSWCILAFSLLDFIIKTHPTLHDSSHGFIGKNSGYFDDDLAHLHEEISSLVTGIHDISVNTQLKFEPSFLDFKQRPLGIPHLEKVTLFNTNKNKTIDMTSISGNTVHFHSSFFEDKKIPPNGNTSFNVVFLGRTEGFIESNLFIRTSEGFLKYNVKGVSTFSHYRIRPIVGVKLPLNVTFSPLIFMHNPYLEPLQILEIYSSGEGFHLELPSGENEGPNELWEIPPLQTKAIIRVKFEAKVVQNYTAYIRIKLNKPNEILVVPLEVEVVSSATIFHPRGVVDFGIGGSADPPKEVKLCLYNPTRKHLKINSISTTSRAIKVQFYNVRLPPVDELEGGKCAIVGSLKLDWKTAFETKDFRGKIIIKFRNNRNTSEIPYFVTPVRGGLKYDPLITSYFVNDKSTETASRLFRVKNGYETPVVIFNVSFSNEVSPSFKIETFAPKMLKVGEETNLFNLKLNDVNLSELQMFSQIVIKTNVSEISVPVQSYDGKLEVALPYPSKNQSLNIGLLSLESEKEVFFMLFNQNPITVYLKHVHSSLSMASISIHGCGSEDVSQVLMRDSHPNLVKCHNLKPSNYAVIRILVKTANVERQVSGHVSIETQFELLKIPFFFKTARGKLEIGPDRLVFDQCFPGKICSHPLRVHSTFDEPMIIEDIVTLPPDKRITTNHSGHIIAHTSKIVGHLYLNPVLECQPECYAGILGDSSATWVKTFSLYKFVSEIDIPLVNIYHDRFLNLTANGLNEWQNLTLRLDTSEVRGHIFETRVKMSWPSLVAGRDADNKTVLGFPLTQVGNVTYRNVTIYNPASHNIVVQLVLDFSYPNVQMLLDRLPADFVPRCEDDCSSSNGFFFFFQNLTRYTQLMHFWETFGVPPHESSLPVVLAPGQNYTVTIGFQARDSGTHSALLFLRNNLTVIEVVRLKAPATFPAFKFGNRRPGSAQPLTFDVTDKHLKDCEKQRGYSNGVLPNLTVKRTFTARNVGDVTVYVNNFYVNGYPCKGYGFRVVDCEPFVLPPNSTKKIDIAFTPDFTMTKVTRTLILSTSLNVPVNYTLYTTIPTSYLNMCADLLARPVWEKYLSYLTIFFMVFLFIIVIMIALIDAEQIRRQAISTFVAPSSPAVQPVLDLRLVGQQTREEIQTCKPEPVHVSEEKIVHFEEKASQNDLKVEIKPSKEEPERYTVLVPVVGKAKKKLGKRNSNEPAVNDEIEVQEKPEKRRDRSVERKVKHKDRSEKEVVKVEEKCKKSPTNHLQKQREMKKALFKIRKPPKIAPAAPVCEEETSSTTTTDSSCSNYEDPEKENQRAGKYCSKARLADAKPKVQEMAANRMTESKISFPSSHYGKVKHHKAAQQTTKSRDKQDKEIEVNANRSNEYQHGRSRENKKQRKEREKKSGYHKSKSRQNEKRAKTAETETEEKPKSPSCFNIPLPPPTTTNSIWGESRAKFSDVVARSDVATGSSCLVNGGGGKPVSKPIGYVEPYKQTAPVELGPIGSRRTDCRLSNESINRLVSGEDVHRFVEDHYRLVGDQLEESCMNSNSFMRDPNSSFFSDEIRLDNCSKESCYLDQLVTSTSTWTRHHYSNPVDAKGIVEIPSSMEDPWNQSLLNSSSYWDSYNPLLNDTPLIADPSLLNENAMVSSQSQPGPPPASSYLWGASPVWQPWAPQSEAHRSPARTPPGFDEFVVHRKRDEPVQEPNENYNPFNTTTLWNQQQNNPWN